MIDSRKLPTMILNLFDGAAGAGTAAGSAGGESGGGTGETQASSGSTRRGSGELANVIYGKGDASSVETDAAGSDSAIRSTGKADVQTTSSTLDAKRQAFMDLVNGEYKDIYTQETQRMIDRRFKETKGLQEQVSKSQPVIDMLLQRYKIADGDMAKLTEALESDDAYWQDAADDAGMTVEQYKRFQQLERQNRQLLDAQRQRQGQQAAQEQYSRWMSEADAVRAKFPGFDINREAQNPQFLQMLKSGVPVEHAYKVIHMDEIINGEVMKTSSETERRVVQNIRARGSRPAENGAQSSSAAFTVKDDVSKLTRKDRAEIARRAAMGQKISF
ncbi:MAG: hypothetical protein MJ074_08410 [Oscillospiraceae bacterium]|nr:hypothetical protein [Oscillospiraceae bacterium]